MKKLILLLLLSGILQAAEISTLEKFQTIYTKGIEKFQKTLDQQKVANGQAVYKQLKNLESAYQKAGKLEKLLALRGFLKTHDSSDFLNLKASDVLDVKAAITKLAIANKESQEQYSSNVAQLQKSYKAALQKKLIALTKLDRIDEALALRAEVEKVNKDYLGVIPSKAKAVLPTKAVSKLKQNHALQFNVNSKISEIHKVVVPTLKDDQDAITVEMWLQIQSEKGNLDCHKFIAGFKNNCRIGSSAVATFDFRYFKYKQFVTQPRGNLTLADQQHPIHVAAIRNGKKKQLTLFVNGKLVDTRPYETFHAVESLEFCSDAMQYAYKKGLRFSGWIDEARVSKTVRYTKDFTPQTRFETDKDTVALFHFDAGEGSTLLDSSGNNHHGKITGAKWIRRK